MNDRSGVHAAAQQVLDHHGALDLVIYCAGTYQAMRADGFNLAKVPYMDLSPLKLGVSVINPGFVATPLTAQNDFHMPALITPEVAAEEILKGLARGDFEMHFPKRFTVWLKGLRHLRYGAYFAAVRSGVGA